MAKRRTHIVLRHLHTAHEWQCAHNAVEHAEPGRKITLTYGTPDGDLTLSVQPVGTTQLVITKEKNHG